MLEHEQGAAAHGDGGAGIGGAAVGDAEGDEGGEGGVPEGIGEAGEGDALGERAQAKDADERALGARGEGEGGVGDGKGVVGGGGEAHGRAPAADGGHALEVGQEVVGAAPGAAVEGEGAIAAAQALGEGEAGVGIVLANREAQQGQLRGKGAIAQGIQVAHQQVGPHARRLQRAKAPVASAAMTRSPGTGAKSRAVHSPAPTI